MSLPPPELEEDEDEDELELEEVLDVELDALLEELLLDDEDDELELLEPFSEPMQAESTMAAPAMVNSLPAGSRGKFMCMCSTWMA